MNSPTEANKENLARLTRLLNAASDLNLYLDLTGLACYRKEDVPAWYNALSERDRWRAQANFWAAIAKSAANHDSVFCYDLINEPLVPASPRPAGDWLTGHLADFWYCQFITLDPAGRDRADIAVQWARLLVSAIREHDKRHLITIGILPNSLNLRAESSGFLPSRLAPELDFLCVHIYPDRKDLPADVTTLKGFNVGKPVVIEETFPMTCSIPQLADFLRDTRPLWAGVTSFYWGKSPAELKDSKEIGDAILLGWLKTFTELAPWK